MTHPFPDLEIYIRTPDIAQLAACLETALSLSHWKQDGSVLRARIRNESSQADVVLHERAYKKYCSLWVTKNLTPWDTDLALAEWASMSSLRSTFDVVKVDGLSKNLSTSA